jgi:hypothetical protein
MINGVVNTFTINVIIYFRFGGPGIYLLYRKP